MAYKQDKPFDTAKAGKKVGFCLQNTRLGYGIGVKYNNAITAWENTVQHKDRNFPKGVAVPLFYTYKKDGHVNVLLPNGHVYSDGVDYPSLADYEAKHPVVKYLGWGETLNAVRVVNYVPDPKPTPAPSTGKRIYFTPLGQTATFFPVKGGSYKMVIRDATYNWNVLKQEPTRVLVNSKSAGGDCWVYLIDKNGKTIPGRYIK